MKAMRRNGRCVTPVLMVVALAVLAAPARADDAMDARQLVEKAKLTFESVIAAPEMDALRDLLKGAKGVFVAPRGALNAGYYDREVSPADILIRGAVSNPHAAPLIELIRKAADAK